MCDKLQNIGVMFIDKVTYNEIINHHLSLEDVISDVFLNDSYTSTKIDANTLMFLRMLNDKMYRWLFDITLLENRSLLKDDGLIKYVEKKLDMFLKTDKELLTVKKYYELTTIPFKSNTIILAVLDEGFLKMVTQNKDNLLEFILMFLRTYINVKNKSGLILYKMSRNYINLKLNDKYFNYFLLPVVG